MRHLLHRPFATGLLVIGLFVVVSNARGQSDTLPANGSIRQSLLLPTDSPSNTPASYLTGTDAPALDLAARVEALEKALQAAKDKEAAAKAKAAGAPSASAGGRIFLDSYTFDQSQLSHGTYGNAENSVLFRAARLEVNGDAFQDLSYQIELDFAQSTVVFKDTFIALHELPLAGNFIAGHYKEPISLEERTSSKYITFMERSLANALCPARNTGVSLYSWAPTQRATWMAGCFAVVGDHPPTLTSDDGPYSVAARVTWLPWYDAPSDGRGLIHLGMGVRYQNSEGTLRFYSRPEVGLFPTTNGTTTSSCVVDTGNFAATGFTTLNPEFALVYGPLSFQSEWLGALTDGYGAIGNAFLHGYYVQVSYFLTGEHRRYKTKAGVFDRIKPIENFFRWRTCDGSVATGTGAWEFAYRFSQLDLNDSAAGVLGGRVYDSTFGVNWYWNPYTRVMLNYVCSTATLPVGNPIDIAGGGGTENIVEMRFQIDF